jgi:hypothetical protein
MFIRNPDPKFRLTIPVTVENIESLLISKYEDFYFMSVQAWEHQRFLPQALSQDDFIPGYINLLKGEFMNTLEIIKE